MENMPAWIPMVFMLTTIATLVMFAIAIKGSTDKNISAKAIPITIILVFWLAAQAALSVNGVYSSNTQALPPRIFLFGILPVIVAIIVMASTTKGKLFLDSLPVKTLTYLSVIRIPVEFVLYGLSLQKAIPELMTFAGRNFDIVAGITAPVVAYAGFTKGLLSKKLILLWNIICLGLLLNIVVHGFLSAPTPMQLLAFDQPNVAILHFPFSWLPVFIVPVVFLCHLVSIRKLR